MHVVLSFLVYSQVSFIDNLNQWLLETSRLLIGRFSCLLVTSVCSGSSGRRYTAVSELTSCLSAFPGFQLTSAVLLPSVLAAQVSSNGHIVILLDDPSCLPFWYCTDKSSFWSWSILLKKVNLLMKLLRLSFLG